MKKIILLLVISVFYSASVIAQEKKQDAQPKNEKDANTSSHYCAILKDGIMVLMQDGTKQVTAEVVLANGVRIMPDGVLIKKDGAKIFLKNGECVDKDGNILIPNKINSTN